MTATYDVVVIGADVGLRDAGVTAVVVPKPDQIINSVFDHATDSWALATRDGQTYCARVVISTQHPHPQHDDMEPYLGIAFHGVPNYFLISEPDIPAKMRYIAECLRIMRHTGSTRIEVRRSTQQLFNERRAKRTASTDWRRMRKRIPTSFEMSTDAPLEDAVHDGAGTLTVDGDRYAVRVRLTGHVDPLDGKYHWQGTVFDVPVATVKPSVPAMLTLDDRTAQARITEQTPWGSYSIAGVGAPPFRLG